MTDPPGLAMYVQPSLSEARIQRQWSNINQRKPSPWANRSALYALSFAAASVLLVVGYLAFQGRSGSHPDSIAGQIVVERDRSGQERITLSEGVTIVVKGESRYRLAERSKQRVHVVLESGTAAFDVTPDKQRRVVVSAAGFDVEVVGTQFEVSLAGQTNKQDLSVRVERGTVRVRTSGQDRAHEPLRTLTAGEAWSTQTNVPSASPIEAAIEPKSEPEPSSQPPSSPVGMASPTVAVQPPTAKGLFEIAQAARIKGNAREAATALDKLRQTYPSDPRAGLASFELGRLRMDQLGDSAGAVSALNDALRLDPSARFSEDAQARLVQLYHRSGNLERCRKAQADYRSRYPNGPHSRGVLGLCTR